MRCYYTFIKTVQRFSIAIFKNFLMGRGGAGGNITLVVAQWLNLDHDSKQPNPMERVWALFGVTSSISFDITSYYRG